MGEERQCLVTGGTGFIGRFVVRQLLAEGRTARVRLLCRSTEKAARLFGAHERLELVAGDLCDRDRVTAACRDVAVVLHLGGAYQFGRSERQRLLDTNVTGTRYLLEAAWKARVEKFVHVSSSIVLDFSADHGQPIREADFPRNISPRESYRHSKWLGECVALEFATRGLPVTIASPTSPLGAGDEEPTPTGRIIVDFLEKRFPFTSRTTLNFINVAELADGILAVAARGRVGERYLLGHHNVWLSDFLNLLAAITGLPAPRHALPRAVIAAAGLVGELTGSNRVCWETACYATKRRFYDYLKAAGELDWHARIPLETSARQTVEWFRRGPTAPGPHSTVAADSHVANH